MTDELKSLKKTALLSEIIRKTESCAIIWNQVDFSQYRATNLPYDFHITKTGAETFVLDVWKNASFYRSYNSIAQAEVEELYTLVDNKLANATMFNRLKTVASLVGSMTGGCYRTHDIEMNGGVRVGLASETSVIRLTPDDSFMLPWQLTFGPPPFVWTGLVQYIDDSPDVYSHDGDTTLASYIRQEVYGTAPTQWGYATIEFITTSFPNSGPYHMQVRVAHRREANDGVTLVVDMIADTSVIFTDTVESEETYSVYDSGLVEISPSITSISRIFVRLSMYTNSGNLDPRALRISAVDLYAKGYHDWEE